MQFMMSMSCMPAIAILCLVLVSSTTLAQTTIEQEAFDKQMDASNLLGDLNSRYWENGDAIDYLSQANDQYSQGLSHMDNQEWQDAKDSFEQAIYLGGEAVAHEESVEIIDDSGMGIPWGDGIDLESIGQGVRESDFPLLIGIVLVSVFVILPVTYRLV